MMEQHYLTGSVEDLIMLIKSSMIQKSVVDIAMWSPILVQGARQH